MHSPSCWGGFKEFVEAQHDMCKYAAYWFFFVMIFLSFFHSAIYHMLTGKMYIQVATNTLERVAPLSHAIGNVLKRVFVIGFSIIVFGT